MRKDRQPEKKKEQQRARMAALWDRHFDDLEKGGEGLIDPIPAFIYSPYHLAGRGPVKEHKS